MDIDDPPIIPSLLIAASCFVSLVLFLALLIAAVGLLIRALNWALPS